MGTYSETIAALKAELRALLPELAGHHRRYAQQMLADPTWDPTSLQRAIRKLQREGKGAPVLLPEEAERIRTELWGR